MADPRGIEEQEFSLDGMKDGCHSSLIIKSSRSAALVCGSSLLPCFAGDQWARGDDCEWKGGQGEGKEREKTSKN